MAGDQAGADPAQHARAQHDRHCVAQVEAVQGEMAAVAAGQFGERLAQRMVGGGEQAQPATSP
jgi:hypothetical protein